jgi:hypothetical protein
LVNEFEIAHGLIEYATDQLEYSVGGGTEFFDRMDAVLSSDYFYQIQHDRFMNRYGFLAPAPTIVVSGKWGYGFKNWAYRYAQWIDPKWVFGGLRHNDLPNIGSPMDLVFFDGNYDGREFIFLDNSCYLGRTRDKIEARIKEAGGELLHTLVLYDGSVEPLPRIEGLFRYHDGE